MPYKDLIKAREYNAKYQRRYNKLNPEVNKKSTKAWIARNKEKIKEYQRNWRITNKDKTAGYDRKNRYGLTQDEYDLMYLNQLGLCVACHEPFGVRKPVVDHNHSTGKVRGLIHSKCNTAIGYIEKNKEKLQWWLEYIENN